ncbi:bacterial alpha-L-rhamnosidase-domain-containing protein [Diaporthe sp. PMI_573]|nr:bacterial alpha-L-rhamnosidase-domain-containing protein [Diaporthaceae sp. PMI_573]
MAVSISLLSFEHHRQALGIAETTPRVSWRFEGDAVDWQQSGYDLEITRGTDGVPKLYNIADSSDSVLVPWPDEALSSAESAKVRVRSHGKDGQISTDWSDTYSVETGLLSTEDWQGAVPIAADRPTEVDTMKRSVLFRKAFDVTAEVASARLYITALGLYIAELNGERVGDHQLAPGYMSYQFRHTYDTYDVTEQIQQGSNAIGVTIGEGWWAGRFGLNSRRNTWGDTLGVQALLVVTSNDGSTFTVKTDANSDWHATAESPVISSDIYDGEVYDFAEEKPDWSTANFNDSSWLGVKELPALQGRLTSPDGPPMRKLLELEPQSVSTTASGKTVVDFGQNLVGWLNISVSGPAGTNITFRHAEVLLLNGDIATEPLRSAKQTDSVILSGNATVSWEPHFTYHGFRYVEVTGWPTDSTPLDASSIRAEVVFSDMERTGYFESSHDLLNKFHENVIWSMRGNFLGVPTDCPQRDERLGWTGDAHAFAPTSNYLYDASGFWRAWLRDLWSETNADPLKASPEFSPTNDPEVKSDTGMLEEQYEGARTWIDQGIPRNEVGLWNRSTWQYGDWLDPKAPEAEADLATTHKFLVADAYLIQMTRLLSNMGAVLGKNAESESYASNRLELVSAFHDAWIKPYDLIANVTQTALALGIRFDIFDSDTVPRAVETLNSVIANNSYLVGTGFAGTQQLGFALTSVNLTSTFYNMLLQTEVPSWLYQVVKGGTTTWERWDSLLPNGTINGSGMTSFNHYAFGSVADWIHQKIGGLAPATPGWKVVQVAPEPGGGITTADASYLSHYGKISASWRVGPDGRGFDLEVVVPPNSQAEVTLPGSKETATVGSGKHTFRDDTFQMPG